MLRDSENNRLFRRVEIKVVYPPDIFKPKKFTYKAVGKNRAYGPDGIDLILMNTADRLDQLYPWWEFEMVPLAPRGRVASYVFKVTGVRAIPPSPEEQATSVTALEPTPITNTTTEEQ
jgi:hypothetical protein